MITTDELKLIKHSFEELGEPYSNDEMLLLEKIDVLIEFDELQSKYEEDRKKLSDKLQEIQSK